MDGPLGARGLGSSPLKDVGSEGEEHHDGDHDAWNQYGALHALAANIDREARAHALTVAAGAAEGTLGAWLVHHRDPRGR